ncbi:MAG TPA: phosphotransferase [Thermoplasmata archaeon]|nr:phosphotransferase [Thermoplasmata archaeon]
MVEPRHLLERYLPELPIRSLRTIEAGWSSRVLDVNGEWIFRIPRTPRDRRAMERAASFYPYLGTVVPVPIPYYAYQPRTPSGRLRFVVYRKLRGRSLPESGLGRPAARRWSEGLANVLRTLHATPTRRAQVHGLRRYDPAAARRGRERQYRSIRRLVWPLLSAAVRRQDESVWEAFLGDPGSFRVDPSVVHGDLYPSHVLTGPGDSGLRGILDWEDASVGDPAGDLALLPTADGFAHEVWARCPALDEACWHRSRFKRHAAFGSNTEYWIQRHYPAKVRGWIRRYTESIP